MSLQSCLELQSSSWSSVGLKESYYVHPLCRRSLSARSLELCTENLGCETGTHDFSSSDDDDGEEHHHRENKRSMTLSPVRSYCRSRSFAGDTGGRNFPPLLRSITGEDGIQVQSRREGGRLVLKAVSLPSSHSYLHAERSDGRLTLRFLSSPFQIQPEQNGENEVEENAVKETEEVKGETIETEESAGDAEEEVTEVDQEEGVEMELNLKENGGECEVGAIEKLKRPSRCKEGGNGNKDWWSMKRFCVASS